MTQPWEPEEERFINQCRRSPRERDIAEVQARCKAELGFKLKSFLGALSTPITQRQIDIVTRETVAKYNQELRDRGINYEITISWRRREANGRKPCRRA